METIISSCIAGAVSIIICLLNNNRQVAIIETKLENLSEQVKKHNSVIERTYDCEKRIAVLETEVKAS